ncbi:hypothetical protein BTH41_04265 [Bacillus mycoides]|nr:hypothetical protein BTH41_04265 [Bacillus mycoides]
MTNLKVTIEVIENKQERDNLVERVEVLDRVKELLLLPNTEVATREQVSEFYGISIKQLDKVIKRHESELFMDGYKLITGKDLVSDILSGSKIEYKKGYILADGSFKLSHRPMGIFPKRAILRVGMLLRDSEVAKEVRTQLLNIEEHSTQEVKTQEIDKEMTLEMNIGRAISKGDYVAVLSEVGLTRTFISASNELSLLR